MTKENQTIEWKESWDDEYLKWICGYANAYGGTMFIGINDKGEVVGLKNAKKLLESIPNKITQGMGIVCDVNLKTKKGLEYLEIKVDKYPMLISLRGKSYKRSGSTLQTITGNELEKQLYGNTKTSWDGYPVPKLKVTDLSSTAIALFKEKAVKNNRLTKTDVTGSKQFLLENLTVIDDNGAICRAGMLAFAKNPEKWVTGAYIKIGYFGRSDSDLQYYDEVHGPLIEQIDKTVDLVYTKYFKALITYEGIQRIEQYMFPKEAFREILLNAVVHKDYTSYNPIQISIYPDHFYVWNDGVMPKGLRTTEQLFKKHSSKPFNPKLANVFFMSGMIEAWGRGFDKIKEACDEDNATLPEYEINEDGIMVYGPACQRYINLLEMNKKLSLGSENPTIDSKNPTIGPENPTIGSENPTIEEKVRQLKLKRQTKENIILLYGQYKETECFGRNDIMNTVLIKDSAAGNLIRIMAAEKIIVPVEGHGKGKYRFV